MSYAQPQGNSNRRLTGLAAVIVFHAAMGYALVNGLARKIVEVVTQPLETKIIEEVKPPPQEKPPPPPPPPRLAAPPPPYIPPPEVQVQVPQSAPVITAITTVKPTEPVAAPGQRYAPAPPAAAPAPPAPRPAPVRTSAVVDAKACDKPEYPAAALRAQETGIVLLAFLIDVDGSALESKVERSSGSKRLDEAARKALGLCKFKPATFDGKPERAWAKIEYEWKLD